MFATAAAAGACVGALRALVPGLQLAALRCRRPFVAQVLANAEMRETACDVLAEYLLNGTPWGDGALFVTKPSRDDKVTNL